MRKIEEIKRKLAWLNHTSGGNVFSVPRRQNPRNLAMRHSTSNDITTGRKPMKSGEVRADFTTSEPGAWSLFGKETR
jgi:hypothetical protein